MSTDIDKLLNDARVIQFHKDIGRIADALENQNKILLERNQTVETAKQIIAELKAEDKELQVDTKVYDDLEIKETTSLFTWYNLKSGGKVRKCSNAPCPHFLKYNEDTRKYQHGKYDAAKEEWYHVADNCEFWGG